MKQKSFVPTMVLLLAASVVLVAVWMSLTARKPASSPAAGTASSEPAATAAMAPADPRAAAVPAAPEDALARSLAPAQDALWEQPVDAAREPHFAAFAEWVRRHQQADAAGKAALESEGVALARQRRAAMFSLIQTDPKRALELAVPVSVREELPATVNDLLEARVSGRGDYSVLAAYPLPGQEGEIIPVQRTVTLDGREYRAFVYGARAEHPTKRGLPLHGVALDGVMAVSENAVRPLERVEAYRLRTVNPAEQICSVSGQSAVVVNEPTPVEVGGTIAWLCRYAHAEVLNEKLLAAAGQPGGAASAGPGGDPEESNYTEGRKRAIMFRVAFTDLPTPDITSNSLVTVHGATDAFWRSNSYFRTSLAALGQGSDIVQVNLANPAAYYDDDAGLFRDDVRAAATAAGVDFSNYDFDVIYSGSGRPAFSFGGLGYVGGPGSWVVGASTTITVHELGHNLGFPHANYWDTGGQSAIGPGGNQEYGDPFDVMGGGSGSGAAMGHYVSKFKWRIGWILDADFPRVTTSGTHRIYAHDNPDTLGLRGVRFPKDASLDYFLEFRQLYTANAWLMSGVGLRWGSPSGSSSQLIDTTPGTTSGKNDASIVLGRTYSDPAANVHVTPVALGNTYPQSIDVVVNFGPYPANRAPRAIVSANVATTNTSALVTFTAAATDADGDTLAYYWDFDDNTFGPNSPTATKSWSSAGDYVVRCTVSDMKGGAWSDSVLVRVGTPTTFSISGRVLYLQQPVPDVLVKASSSRYTYTDSDGTYHIPRLSAGGYTLSAQLHPYTFAHPFFVNPVTLGPGATNLDFLRVLAPQNDVTLVATGSVWKYLDNGTDQAAAWIAPGFPDATWFSGPGQLGYGDGDEATVVSYGADAANKYATTYFRRAFNVPEPSILTNFILNFLRDDGGAVYLNGTEILRDNLAVGATFATFATDVSEGTTAVGVPASAIVAGSNVFAVEVHQATANSSDLSFDLSLVATSVTNFSGLSTLYIASPASDAAFTAPTNVPITANALHTDGPFTLVEFYAGGSKIGESAAPPFTMTWSNPPVGAHVLTARGSGVGSNPSTSAPVNVTLVTPPAGPTPGVVLTAPTNGLAFFLPGTMSLAATAVASPGQSITQVEFYSGAMLLGADATPSYTFSWNDPPQGAATLTARAYESGGVIHTSPAVNVTVSAPRAGTQLISRNALWRYLDDGSDAGTAWRARTFDDSDWRSGYARLGYGGDGELTTVSSGPDPAKRYVTTWFRRAFNLSSTTGIGNLRFQVARDDGVVVYLNGNEVWRSNLRTGLVSYNSLALATVNAPEETNFFDVNISPAGLVAGTNVVAVEVHQVAITSTDVGFDLALAAERNTNLVQGVYLTAPAQGARLTLPAPVNLSAFAIASGDTVSKVGFYANGLLLGEDASTPFSLAWSPGVGAHTLAAVAQLGGGASLTSAPVNVTVDGPPMNIGPVMQTYVTAGAAWRYWSNGVTPAPNWMARELDDSAWSLGNARFGWGLDGEATTLPGSRVTHYFRRWLTVTNPALLDMLIFQLQRDDGAIVYLNGLELYRSNMPGGPVTSNTASLAGVDGLDEQQFFITTLPPGGLVAGTNLLAVELHQSGPTSSDAGFALHLAGSGNTAPRVVLNSPLDGASYALPASVEIEASGWAGSSRAVSKIEFLANGSLLGESMTPPYRFTWLNPPAGTQVLTARQTDNFGATVDSAPVSIGLGFQVVSTNLIATGSVWRYLDNGSNQGTNWAQRSFSDSGWAFGPAELGYGDGDEARVVNGGPTGNRFITTYFRRWFNVVAEMTLTNLTFSLRRDDGAVVWLNGREAYRSNMPVPPTAITSGTLASSTVDNANEDAFFVTSLATTNVLAGTSNLVAVEIHQVAASSSDISFELALQGAGYILALPPPELDITLLPGGFVRISWLAPSTGWTLYVTEALGSGENWEPAGGPVVPLGGQLTVTYAAASTNAFYRLQKP